MRIKQLTAPVVVSLSLILVSASCAQHGPMADAGEGKGGGAPVIVSAPEGRVVVHHRDPSLPHQQAQDAPGAEAAEEDGVERMPRATEDVGEARDETRWWKQITCNPDEYGPYCYRKCKEAGISCGAAFHHPRFGLGELEACLSAPGIDACDYSHDDCIHCYLFKKLGSWAPAYCVLQGGKKP